MKPFTCGVCGKSFIYSEILKVHMTEYTEREVLVYARIMLTYGDYCMHGCKSGHVM